jgi:arginase
VQVRDLGDVSFTPPLPERDPETGIIAPQTFVEMVFAVRKAVSHARREGCFPLVIGGDCGLLLGCLDAIRATSDQPGLLFVDGHEDAYAPHASPSGETADMEMNLALGLDITFIPDRLLERLPLLTSPDVVMLGPRDRAVLRSESVPSLDGIVEIVDDVALRDADLTVVTQDALREIRASERPWWLHTDLDVLSTEALPAVDYWQPGGLNWEQFECIAFNAIRADHLCGWDITIYNPDLDPDRRSAVRIINFIADAIAHRIT